MGGSGSDPHRCAPCQHDVVKGKAKWGANGLDNDCSRPHSDRMTVPGRPEPAHRHRPARHLRRERCPKNYICQTELEIFRLPLPSRQEIIKRALNEPRRAPKRAKPGMSWQSIFHRDVVVADDVDAVWPANSYELEWETGCLRHPDASDSRHATAALTHPGDLASRDHQRTNGDLSFGVSALNHR